MTFKPSALHAHLQSIGAKALKHSSQNFLIDGNILQKIVSAAGVEKGDHILEIGPGAGALTGALLAKGAHVLAVEKDPLLAKGLAPHPLLDVREADFLELDLDQLLSGNNYKVVANLPYHITSPILGKLLPLHQKISSVTVMVQKEVGERIIAKSGTKDYNRLALFAAFYSEPTYCFTVSPNSFFPKPKVHSCVVHFVLKKPPKIGEPVAKLQFGPKFALASPDSILRKVPMPHPDMSLCEEIEPALQSSNLGLKASFATGSEDGFFAFVQAAFGKKRKMIRSSLSSLYPAKAIEEALRILSLPPTSRPEELSLENFMALFEALSSTLYNF